MTTDGKSFCGSDEIDRLAKRLIGRRRILLWGEMGIGKSSLALQLLPQLGRQAGHCRLLELDPGSAPFGIPGTVCRAWLTPQGFDWGDCQALCTLDSARFRLPLVLAAGRLLAIAAGGDERGPLLIDPPGVVRGVGGAELLTALAASCGVDAVVAIRRGEGGLPLAVELASLGADLIPVAASPAARLPARLERLKNRTRLWNHWLQASLEQVLDLDRLLVLGTPPPREVPAAWAGQTGRPAERCRRNAGGGGNPSPRPRQGYRQDAPVPGRRPGNSAGQGQRPGWRRPAGDHRPGQQDANRASNAGGDGSSRPSARSRDGTGGQPPRPGLGQPGRGRVRRPASACAAVSEENQSAL